MKKKFLFSILCLFLFFIFVGNISAENDSRYPVMRADPDTWLKWMNDHETAFKAKITEDKKTFLIEAQSLNFSTSMDLLDNIDYDPLLRNQGSCGNCWAWASTGLMEIEHDFNNGVFDRLSVQYINSCRAPGDGCCGNNISTFAAWYSAQGLAVPWDNTNAAFADGANCCRDASNNPCPPATACASILTAPHYPITSISESRIDTTTFWDNVNQATAIANIKAVLNDDKGVYFGFSLPNDAAWDDFFDFWDGVGVPAGDDVEETLWDHPDDYCGNNWNDAQGGGHAVVILGYNDDDADPANHYWLALNSWATAGGDRPNGLFRIPTQMNYSCIYPIPNSNDSIAAFTFYTLDVEFGNALPIADANGPYTADCEGTTTTIDLDGLSSLDLEGPLNYLWSTTCPGGIFNNATVETPVLTVDTSPGCSVSCNVKLVVTDAAGDSDDDTASVTISDTVPPETHCPSDFTIECDTSTEPSNTGSPIVIENCDPNPDVAHSDVEVPGSCPQEKTITRTWTAMDSCGNSSSCMQTINVVDTTPPVINLPADVTIECDESSDPSNTGFATANDNCGTIPPIVVYSDVEVPGSCPQEKTITRTWTATDSCGNSSSDVQTIEVVDTTAPVIACNEQNPITPPDAPISFTATATDNCDNAPDVAITSYGCYKFTKKGKKIDKAESCIVDVAGAKITILDSGGVDDHITWTVEASDECGNNSEQICEVIVVNPAQ